MMTQSSDLRFLMERKIEQMQRDLDAIKLLLEEIKWESEHEVV